MKDFVPWVHPESSQPSDLEEGEEEEEMTRLLDRMLLGNGSDKRVLRGGPIKPKDRVGLLRMGIRRCRRLSFRARQKWG